MSTCKKCKGTKSYSSLGHMVKPCDTCNGTGYAIDSIKDDIKPALETITNEQGISINSNAINERLAKIKQDILRHDK